ncbi:N-acetyltransferase family protein [Saccharospirillum sp.]|uniref:N-acetyltransferase family protein n=1 Tax=Saccharospirillum sp. TaxID=2033801 RepID=UPI0034A00EAD
MLNDILIRPAQFEDSLAIAQLYNPYIRDTIITFEEAEVAAQDIRQRMQAVNDAGLFWRFAEHQGDLAGYAYATAWRPRHAYRFSVEVTAYVSPEYHGKGVGSCLYDDLLPALKKRGIHSAMGGIALPNDASIALHEKFGFKKVAHFEAVGFKFNRWIDVGYWQLLL